MDEDLAIINKNTRNERIKNFILENKKKLIFIFLIILSITLIFFGYKEFANKKKIKNSNLYNSVIIEYSEANKDLTANKLIKIINKKDTTYSPLSLYFIIDNALISDRNKINDLFNVLINETHLENEIKNLIIYKKALFNADYSNESDLLEILNPLINSKSIWRSHALYLAAEYFYSKNEKQKSKEFFTQILNIENVNIDIQKKSRIRLNRDFGD